MRRPAPGGTNWFQLYVVLGVSILLVWLFKNSTVESVDRQCRGAIIVVLGFLPLIFFAAQQKRNYFPLFPLNTAYYAFGFGLGGFSLSTIRWEGRAFPDDVRMAQFVVMTGIICQCLGYFLGRGTSLFARPTLTPLSPRQLRICGWLMFVFSLIPFVVAGILKIPSVGMLFRIAGMAGVTLLFHSAITGNMKRIELAIFSVLALFVYWQGILTGSMAEGLRFGMIFAVVALYAQRAHVAVIIGGISVVVLFLLNPVKGEYRAVAWNSWRATELSSFEKTQIFYDLTSQYWTGRIDGDDEERNSTLDRLNQFPLLYIVVADTPTPVPYWNGETYFDIVYSLVPCIFWPNKPNKRTGNEFGQRYYILHSRDNVTSLNLPWLVEFYANFGWIGVSTIHDLNLGWKQVVLD